MPSDEPLEGRCGAKTRDDGFCENYPVEGSDRCRMHGGAADSGPPEGNDNAVGNAGGGAPENNANAASHGLHADPHTFYTEIATDGEREVIDKVFADYLERYRDRHGEPGHGDREELFLAAVTIGKELHGEAWAVERPAAADAGNALIDREPIHGAAAADVDDGTPTATYSAAAVQRAIQRLSSRRRQWLKDMGLLEIDPEATEPAGDLVSAIAEHYGASTDGDGED